MSKERKITRAEKILDVLQVAWFIAWPCLYFLWFLLVDDTKYFLLIIIIILMAATPVLAFASFCLIISGRMRCKATKVLLSTVPLVLCSIIIIFFAWVAIRIDGPHRLDSVKIQIANFSSALELLKSDVGRYPSTVEGLQYLTLPSENFGPYMNSIPKDPWGHDFKYELINNQSYRISSSGEDGCWGTNDDVTSSKDNLDDL